jgi:hypothetical protein
MLRNIFNVIADGSTSHVGLSITTHRCSCSITMLINP